MLNLDAVGAIPGRLHPTAIKHHRRGIPDHQPAASITHHDGLGLVDITTRYFCKPDTVATVATGSQHARRANIDISSSRNEDAISTIADNRDKTRLQRCRHRCRTVTFRVTPQHVVSQKKSLAPVRMALDARYATGVCCPLSLGLV